MATSVEVPEVKLAKVNQDREKKRGGVPIPPGGAGTASESIQALSGTASRVAFRASTNGLMSMVDGVFGRGLAALLPKIMVGTMVCCMGYGAVCVGRAMKAVNEISKAPASKPKAFNNKPAPEVRTEGVGHTQGMQNSLNMVGGGLYGDPNAQATQQAAADAKAKNDGAPAEQPNAAAAPAGAAAMDPAAMAAAAAASAGKGEGDKKDQGQKGFGAFSGQLGGGGGGSHSFNSGPTVAAAPGGGRINNFSSGESGVGRMASPLSRSRGIGRGAAGQLGFAASQSKAAARNPVAETASYGATQAFQPGQPTDQALTGGGAGTGAGGGTTSSADKTTGASSGGSGSGGGGNGSIGGAVAPPDNCSALFPNGDYINSPEGGCVCPGGQDSNNQGQCATPSNSNATPWQKMSDWAKWLLMAAGAILLIASLLALTKVPWLHMIAYYACYVAMVLAGIATLLGIGIMMMGGGAQMQGLVYTIGGAITTYSAYKAAEGMAPHSNQELSNMANQEAGVSASGATGGLTSTTVTGANGTVSVSGFGTADGGTIGFSGGSGNVFGAGTTGSTTWTGSGADGGSWYQVSNGWNGGANWGWAGGASGIGGGAIGGWGVPHH